MNDIKISMTQFLSVLCHLPNPNEVRPDIIISVILQDEKSWISDDPIDIHIQHIKEPISMSGTLMKTIILRFKCMYDKAIPYWKPEKEITIY